MNISKEDYLGEIYRIQYNFNRAAKLTELAKALKISKPSASQMVRRLAQENLVTYERYGAISLTKQGTEQARSLIRKHQLLEVFFNKLLNIKHRFHHEAHNMEHSLSDEAADKLDAFLKKPAVCPDGNPIPSKNKNIIELSELPEGCTGQVLFATTKDDSCLEQLNALGLVPQTNVKVLRKIGKGPSLLLVKDSEVALGNNICSKIFVEKK